MKLEILYYYYHVQMNWLYLDIWLFSFWIITDVRWILGTYKYEWNGLQIGIRFGSKVFEKRWRNG